MICKPCSDLVGLPGRWHPHSRLKTPGQQVAQLYVISPGQLLYGCASCRTVLLKGRNTGWSLAQSIDAPVDKPAADLAESAVERASPLTA